MGEAKAEAKPYLAWLIGGDRWYVVRDASEGDVAILGHVRDRELLRGEAAVHVRRWEEANQHELTRPFCVQKRIDNVTFQAIDPPAQGNDAGGWFMCGFLAATLLAILAGAGVVLWLKVAQ